MLIGLRHLNMWNIALLASPIMLVSSFAVADEVKANAPIACAITIGDAEIGCKNVTITDLDGARAEVTAAYDKGFFRLVGWAHKGADATSTTITIVGIQKDSANLIPAEGACGVGSAIDAKSTNYVSCNTYSAFGEVEIRSKQPDVKR